MAAKPGMADHETGAEGSASVFFCFADQTICWMHAEIIDPADRMNSGIDYDTVTSDSRIATVRRIYDCQQVVC